MANPIDPEKQERLMRRQAALTALTEHPSWADLLDEVANNEESIRKRVLAITLYSPEAADQLEISYLRGFLKGMKWFVAVPRDAEASLEKALRKRGIALEGSR